ncbi:inositol monophosphatase 3-like isoform X2 [Megalops cyprinoides]|uniref:inositol monophosphatase 3-like isoform X2 n=1 Tax=Megalops cyprinoides TaxID=118141 RepID=UPI00186566D9|nr:inositol monophosphatase 3-like isoform X2 [Megalops cyprinoides]
MAPMGIRLSPLGVVVFCLLGLGVIYHLYAGMISNRISAFKQGKTVDLRELLALSVEAAVQGGREVKRIREDNTLDEKSKGKTKEGASEKLTLGDLNSHKKMFHLIKNTFPYLQVNSEEHDSTGESETAVWNHVIPAEIAQKVDSREVPAESVTVWIDPLDATQEYTAWAMVGAGANVRARETYSEKAPQVIVSRSHAGKVKGFIGAAFGNDTVIIPAGGAGYKVLALLDPPDDKYDKADVYIHITYIKKWDICAGNAILKALGGHMTTLKGEEIDYRGHEANNGGLLASINMDHKALVEKLPSLDKERG